MKFCLWTHLGVLPLLCSIAFAKEIQKLCQSADANKSCGQCIKQHPECAWCLDPQSPSSMRCDLRSSFNEARCAAQYVYSPETELKIAPQHNLPLASKHADGVTVIQLEPQQVVIKMKPGDIVEVPFKYLHKLSQVRDFMIQTSEFRSRGLGIEFSIECHGNRIQGRECANVQPDETIHFYAKVSLNECRPDGDIAVSIGTQGYNTVSAIFVTPLCGCECEIVRNQERRSPSCHSSGSLICGVCVCDQGKGGAYCECNLETYGVTSADALEDRCRSGKGRCRCGQCQCEADYITGQYCECDGVSCPAVNGKLCAGNGMCQCGICKCEAGFSGIDCACTDDKICNGRGQCQCGKCACNADFRGPTCGGEGAQEPGESNEIDTDVDNTMHTDTKHAGHGHGEPGELSEDSRKEAVKAGGERKSNIGLLQLAMGILYLILRL